MTYKHGQALIAKQAFTFKNPDSGRLIDVKAGAFFWVTTPPHEQSASGFCTIDRKGRGTISHGYRFSFADMAQLFEITGKES